MYPILLAVGQGREQKSGVNRINRFMPWVSMEEAEVIEDASRRAGMVPAQFMKEAGLAVALAVLASPSKKAGKGRIQCVSDIRWKHCIDGFR